MANPSIGNIEKVRALAANARLLLVGGTRAAADSRLTAFDAGNNKVLWTAPVPAHVLGLALAGEQYAAACADGTVRFGSLTDGTVKFQLNGAHPGGCTAAASSPDGKVLYTAGLDGMVRAWDWDSTRKLKEWTASAQPLRAVAVDPTHTYVACAGDDGVVRSFTVATGAKRDMPGHEGAVRALAFTPRDGRVVSAGDDGKLRIWYLVGAVEFETRGDKDSGHAGAVLGLVFPPTPPAEAGQEPAERIASVGGDGKLKVWRLDERRKPRTFELGTKALHAVAYAPPANPRQAKQLLGFLFTGGDERAVTRLTLGTDGKPTDETQAYAHGFDVIQATLKAAYPRREAAVKEAAALQEPEALEFVLGVLSTDPLPDARKLAATELGNHGRAGARAKLRERLNDDDKGVRAAALDALAKLETESPLAAPRAALESRFVDMRVQGLRRLAKLGGSSPLVPGLIAGSLADA
jgi:ParB family transcriptional regulator, chromosome partitioning protein